MKKMTMQQIADEALSFLADWDGGKLSEYVPNRTATDIADFALEAKFADMDEDCDWSDEECQRYFDLAQDALMKAAVPQ